MPIESDIEKQILQGMAIADAMGQATQDLSLNAIYQTYGKKGVQNPPQMMTLSDETHGAIASYKSCKSGTISLSTLEDLSFATLSGIIFHGNDTLFQQLYSELKNTPDEKSRQSILCGIASAYVMTLALNDIHPQNYLAKVWNFCSDFDDDFDMTIRKIGHVLGWSSETHAMRHLGKGKTAPEIVTLALYCVMKYPDSYVDAVRRAANTPGDSHIIAAITGAIMTARTGFEQIPDSWQNLDNLENIF